jgi:uroporphyrinogen decarboxylase
MMQQNNKTLIEREKMSESARKLRDFYDFKTNSPIYQKEFYFYITLDLWISQGYLKRREDVADYPRYIAEVFGYDEPGITELKGLGWCEAGFYPEFEEKILEDRGKYELVQDFAGRGVLYFKGRRNGFMPEYLDHPVKDIKTWEENVKWRLIGNTEGRLEAREPEIQKALDGEKKGNVITQKLVGGFMYLRSLMGPSDLLYKFYDDPDLIHECLKTWFELADYVIAHHQKYVALDEVFIDEDICYNSGSLISPDMIKEFLLPYYQQLYTNIKRRNLDPARKVHFQVDTDGYCVPVIDLYRSVGCDFMSPFEVASGCDVVEIAKKYPDLLMSGGIDKRILAEGKDAIDRHLEYIMPFMKQRGGYIPTCDHGVPEEVSFENYMHYRKRMLEYR